MTAGPDLIRVGHDRFRVLPWQGNDAVALMAPLPGARPPGASAVRECIDLLASRGVREVVTAALARSEVDGFLAAGFQVRERLHLLSHDLQPIPTGTSTGKVRLRRARTTDRLGVLSVDSAAFDGFWRLDQTSLADALEATSASRFRVVAGTPIAGFLITGRAGTRGYLQRLAVRPEHQRCGIGSALVIDGLRWLRRHGCGVALVNTQETNLAAVAAYESLGFRHEADGLAVLALPIGPM